MEADYDSVGEGVIGVTFDPLPKQRGQRPPRYLGSVAPEFPGIWRRCASGAPSRSKLYPSGSAQAGYRVSHFDAGRKTGGAVAAGGMILKHAARRWSLSASEAKEKTR